jgi:hypothetical protein
MDKLIVTDTLTNLHDVVANDVNIQGRVIIRNPATGKIIHQGDNLVVLSGRAFALQMISGFNISNSHIDPQDADYRHVTYSPNRRICLFQVGIGASNSGSPTDVIAPEWSDWYLRHPVPFVIGVENRRANVHFLQGLVPASLGVSPVVDGYYGKTFDKPPELQFDASVNKAYLKFEFSIDATECRGHVINEIGLFVSSVMEGSTIGGETMELATPVKLSLFSKYTMNPRDFTDNSEGYDVEYRVYC